MYLTRMGSNPVRRIRYLCRTEMLLVRKWPLLFIGAVFFVVVRSFTSGDSKELRVLLNATDPAAAYDPVKKLNSASYFLLENIYSPLLEYSPANELVSGLAKKFEWVGSEARFYLRDNVRTLDGQLIDAWDAELSLKRQFIRGGPGAVVLREMLCGALKPANLTDACEGLEVRENGRLLVMKFKAKNTFVFHLLTDISYAIIPRASIDKVDLNIRDYRNTSGPYYIDTETAGGNMALRPNPGHYRFSEAMPQRVRIVPLDGHKKNKEILEYLSKGEIDYLGGGIVRSPDDKFDFAKKSKDFNLYLSQPIRMLFVVFSEHGMKSLTREERLFIGRKLREIYPIRHKISETPEQIFKLEGLLTREQLRSFKEALGKTADRVLGKRLETKMLYGYYWLDEGDIRKWFPNAVYADREPFRSRKNIPPEDFSLLGCEVGFQDDVGMISYFMRLDFFAMTAKEKSAWLLRYVGSADRAERDRMLRDLQYRTMMDAKVIPLAVLPYASLSRKPWKPGYPSALSGDPLWRLRR